MTFAHEDYDRCHMIVDVMAHKHGCVVDMREPVLGRYDWTYIVRRALSEGVELNATRIVNYLVCGQREEVERIVAATCALVPPSRRLQGNVSVV